MDDMPDRSPDHAYGRRTAAIASVDRFVVDSLMGERLHASDLKQYGKKGFRIGWRMSVPFSDRVRELRVLADDDFPYTAPRISVADGPPILTWPHLERDGMLCLLPSDASVSSEYPDRVVKEILGDARRLIEDCVNDRRKDDFRKEFLSYWAMATDAGAARFVSLVEPCGPSRRLVVWRGRTENVVGDKAEALKQWLSRWRATPEGLGCKLDDGVLIWLPEPLLPVDYPRTAADVRTLARERSPEALSVLEELAASKVDAIDVLLGAPTSNGTSFGAVRVSAAERGAMLEAGFRPSHAPRSLLASRYLAGSATVTKAAVDRADHQWIHGRDRDHRQERLRKRRVAVVGVGSVGGSVAKLLAQAGVGELFLVDPGVMDWSNVGRHQLGAASVGHNKAVELMREINRACPHVETSIHRDRFGPAASSVVRDLASYDLIISATGNWAAEGFLNDVQHGTNGHPPVLYAWVEPQAAAAHAVLVFRGQACFQCGVNDKGRANVTVTGWAAATDLQEPTCGATFTPYGPVELQWAHALVVECAIDALLEEETTTVHRVWIGRRARVEEAGGSWSEKWIAEFGDPGSGGVTLELPWPASATCLVCARREHPACNLL